MFSRVLVANRGEIAVRVIRALHELGVEALAVYSTADEDALQVRLPDRAVRIGPPPAAESYLHIPALVAAAETTGCEAVHPGYGFLSENADFVRACEDNDLVFVGPPAEVMERMGDKARAKAEMRAAGVPLVPGTEGIAGPDDALAAAEELGFPVLLKAAAGGGGKGMRVVTEAGDLHAAYERAAAESQAAFGDDSLYVEKVIAPARHVEIQVLCDDHGHFLTCGERECSVQRRHQKLIEESPSPALDDERSEAMEDAAERACRHIGYRNAGTFEFLAGPDGSFSFIELNARLQVEHPVTESVIGIDIVREQVRIAAGGAPCPRGAARPRGGRRPCPRRSRRPAQRPRDRAAHQRGGPGARVRPGARSDRALPTAARAWRPRRHVRRERDRDLAALRLADREGRRLGRHAPPRNQPSPARAGRARDRGCAHHTRCVAGHPPQRRVPERRVLDVLP